MSGARSRIAEYEGPDIASERSHTFSVELDEDGAAPAPPNFVQRKDGKRIPYVHCPSPTT